MDLWGDTVLVERVFPSQLQPSGKEGWNPRRNQGKTCLGIREPGEGEIGISVPRGGQSSQRTR